MSRFAIASEFDDGRRFFAGSFDCAGANKGQVVPVTTAQRDAAFVLTTAARFASTLALAEAVARQLGELSKYAGDPRTWIVVELPAVRS